MKNPLLLLTAVCGLLACAAAPGFAEDPAPKSATCPACSGCCSRDKAESKSSDKAASESKDTKSAEAKSK